MCISLANQILHNKETCYGNKNGLESYKQSLSVEWKGTCYGYKNGLESYKQCLSVEWKGTFGQRFMSNKIWCVYIQDMITYNR